MKVVALDIAKEYLNANVHTVKILADASNLPLVNESFTTVVATEILEHLEHPDRAIKEIKRVLKKDGQAIISVPDRYASFSQVEHIQFFSQRKIIHLFKDFTVNACEILSTGQIFCVFKVIK
jgi:ubiquinone/menaquinone biosynthesis C-methylase UbiE